MKLALLIFAALLPTTRAWSGDLFDAARDGDLKTIRSQVEKDKSLLERITVDRETLLHVAAHHGRTAVVVYLLEQGADINVQCYNEYTPLTIASRPETVRALLAYGPDLSLECVEGTALQQAADKVAWLEQIREKKMAKPWRRIVSLLRDAGAEYDIHSAIYLDDLKQVKALLEKNPEAARPTGEYDRSPLRSAAQYGREAICKELLRLKADPDDFELGCGFPILVDAIGHPTVVRLLLDAGADVKTRITWRGGRTGIWFVDDEATALHYAAKEGDSESAAMLLKHGVEIDAQDGRGDTALHIAALLGRPTLVRQLLKAGANPKLKNENQKTPLDGAGERSGAMGPDPEFTDREKAAGEVRKLLAK